MKIAHTPKDQIAEISTQSIILDTIQPGSDYRYDHFLAAVVALVTAFLGPLFPLSLGCLSTFYNLFELHGSRGQAQYLQLKKEEFSNRNRTRPSFFAHEWTPLIISIWLGHASFNGPNRSLQMVSIRPLHQSIARDSVG